MALDKELLEILACPKCKGDVELDSSGKWILCKKCGIKYPVRDDIPVMLIEEAVPIEERKEGNA